MVFDHMNKKYFYPVLVLLVLATLIAFGRTTGNDFINFDDNKYIIPGLGDAGDRIFGTK